MFKKRVVAQAKKRTKPQSDEEVEVEIVTKIAKNGPSRTEKRIKSTTVQVGHEQNDAQEVGGDKLESHEQEVKEEKAMAGIYRGRNQYAKFLEARESLVKIGPQKLAPSNIRTTTVVDYQPDVCKDYKLTGYCGYGDSCKFLHAREDYAAGWQLDKEWEELQAKGKHVDRAKTPIKTDETVPFRCPICKNEYKNPVETLCKHYFCEACFLKEYRKRPSCFICEKDTLGNARPVKSPGPSTRTCGD